MRHGDHFIFNEGDQNILSKIHAERSRVNHEPISLAKSESTIAYLAGKYLIFKDGDKIKKVSKDSLPIRGKHNMLNSMAAIKAARNLGIGWEGILNALKTFENAPHRLEYSGNIKGVDFFNDSKATNVDALWYALESFEKPILLIMGGTDKGNDYTQIDGLVKDKVKAIIALGLDNSKIESHFKNYGMDVSSTDSIFQAVEIAYSKALENEVVLLSPACASFDLFKNYEERGERFKEAVWALKGKMENNLMMVI